MRAAFGRPSPTAVRPAGMDEWLMVYTIEGSGYRITDAVEATTASGTVALPPLNTLHRYGIARGSLWNFMWALFLA